VAETGVPQKHHSQTSTAQNLNTQKQISTLTNQNATTEEGCCSHGIQSRITLKNHPCRNRGARNQSPVTDPRTHPEHKIMFITQFEIRQ